MTTHLRTENHDAVVEMMTFHRRRRVQLRQLRHRTEQQHKQTCMDAARRQVVNDVTVT